MTPDQVDKVLLPLIMAYDFDDGLATTYAERLATKTAFEVAMQTASYFIDSWEGMGKPKWRDFNAQYDRFYQRMQERLQEERLALGEGQGRMHMVSPREGRGIAAVAYAKEFRRSPPGDIFAIPDPEALPKATQEEIDATVNVLSGGYDHEGMTFSRYIDVLRVFDGHHRTARAALAALEAARRIVHRPDGVIILLPHG